MHRVIVVALAAIAMSLSSLVAAAEFKRSPVAAPAAKVTSVKPSAATLIPGGKAVVIHIQGINLKGTQVYARANGSQTRDLVAKIISANDRMLRVSLSASRTASARRKYDLVLRSRRGAISTIRLVIRVRGLPTSITRPRPTAPEVSPDSNPPEEPPAPPPPPPAFEEAVLFSANPSDLPFGAKVSVVLDERATEYLGASALNDTQSTLNAANSQLLTQIESGPGIPLQLRSVTTRSMSGLGYTDTTIISERLSRASDYRMTTPGELSNSDVTVLVTYGGNVVSPGLAYVGTLCTNISRSVMVIRADLLKSSTGPVIVAHMLGHLVGMTHVSSDGVMDGTEPFSTTHVMGYPNSTATWSAAAQQFFQERKPVLSCSQG